MLIVDLQIISTVVIGVHFRDSFAFDNVKTDAGEACHRLMSNLTSNGSFELGVAGGPQ